MAQLRETGLCRCLLCSRGSSARKQSVQLGNVRRLVLIDTIRLCPSCLLHHRCHCCSRCHCVWTVRTLSYTFDHRNLISYTYVAICPWYVHKKYKVIVTFFVIFFGWLYCPYVLSKKLHVKHTYVCLHTSSIESL